MYRHTLSVVLAAILVLSAAPMEAGWRPCKRTQSPDMIDLTQSLAAETVKGPAKVQLKNVNHLRYDVKISSTATVTAAPDLTSFGFIPAVPSAPSVPTMSTTSTRSASPDDLAADSQSALKPVDNEVKRLAKRLTEVATTIQGLLGTARTAQRALAQESGAVQSLVGQSDAILARQGDTALIAQVNTREGSLNRAFDPSTGTLAWPSDTALGDARRDLSNLTSQLEELPFREPNFSQWAQLGNNRDEYRDLLQSARNLGVALRTLESGSDERKEFEKQRTKLAEWHGILSRLTAPGSFEADIDARCDNFVTSKSTVYKITKTDRLATDVAKATQELTLITVECPTSFTVSGGAGMTGIDETDIKLVSAPRSGEDGSETVTKIAFEDRGSEQVNPIFLMNTRFTDWNACNWHVSAGTVLDMDNPSSNVTLGYVLGLSFSIRDNFYLTGGVQFGRVAKLTAGAREGQVVAEGLAKPPIERSWEPDWMVAASFKIR